jgi:hypothetical protein
LNHECWMRPENEFFIAFPEKSRPIKEMEKHKKSKIHNT